MYFELFIGPVKLGYISSSKKIWSFSTSVEGTEKLEKMKKCKYTDYTECIRAIKNLFPGAGDILNIIHYQGGRNIGSFNHEAI